MLDARYLNDENGYHLESAVEGDGAEQRFAVRSTAPEGSQHSWRGLDARR